MTGNLYVVTSGATYLDVDAYAGCIAYSELLNLLGQRSVAFSTAEFNYSIAPSILGFKKKFLSKISEKEKDVRYVVVDVSDPKYLEKTIEDMGSVNEVFDHHVGFEEFWRNEIGERAKIEFIGAACTLIFEEWKKKNKLSLMNKRTAALLICGILDNTLNLKAKITTDRDIYAVNALKSYADTYSDFYFQYFNERQTVIESNIIESISKDIKTIRDNEILPVVIGQLAIWDADNILSEIHLVTNYMDSKYNSWLFNLIDIRRGINYLICNDEQKRNRITAMLNVTFDKIIAQTSRLWLRKELIKESLGFEG